MKHTYLILLLISNLLFAHKNTVHVRTFGNVKVVSSTSYTNELSNINFIVGKYAEALCEKLHYKDTLRLFLSNDGNEANLKCFFNQNQDKKISGIASEIYILTKKREIGKCLNLVEFLVLNKNNKKIVQKLNRERGLLKIYEKTYSKLVLEILGIRMDRLDEFEELFISNEFNYYVQDDSINFYHIENNKNVEVFKTKYLIDIKTIEMNHLIITIQNMNVVIISIESEYNKQLQEDVYNFHVSDLYLDNLYLIFKPYKINLIGKKYISIEDGFEGDEAYVFSLENRKLVNGKCD